MIMSVLLITKKLLTAFDVTIRYLRSKITWVDYTTMEVLNRIKKENKYLEHMMRIEVESREEEGYHGSRIIKPSSIQQQQSFS